MSTLSRALPWSSPLAEPAARQPQTLAELDEPALIERAGLARDGRAFAELIRRHQGKVRSLLLRLAGQRSLADDLAQEAFLRAYRGLAGFQGRASFATWLYRIAYNVFLNHRARTKVHAALPENFAQGAAAPESELSPARADLRRDLEGAILSLPDRYRVVITLYYLEDISYPEIAEILDLPLGTVKTHLHRAKRLLRAEMRGWEGEASGG